MDVKSTPEEGRARWIRGWGLGGAVPNKPLTTIAILWPVKAIFEKRAATVEIDTLILP